ncbi:MAG: cytochrome C [Acidithiobacillales bacterium SG8_45]|jgi:ubiquinol-cytochrome c reductase cytochrome c1 subunit|nr:MAG: cytochrome C [Acidithiobacillales bacterium SG8_45]
MKKLLITVMLALAPAMVYAAGGSGAKLDHVKVDLSDQASLQNGAKIFVNYCLSCHSASYMRYNRMAKDIGLTEEQLAEHMGFITDDKGKFKSGALMKATIGADEAKAAFNTVPPDLSVISRARGADWFYTYMRSFYIDEKTPSGWNNVVFPNVSMPHVLWSWQGTNRAVFKTDDHGVKHFEGFEVVKPGSMTDKEFDKSMQDLTAFMVYMGEPARLVRFQLGVYVLIFLAFFGVFAYLLKKNYWKDVH